MGRAKPPNNEARSRRLDEADRSLKRNKRCVKLSVNGGWRNAWKKLQRMIWAGPPSLNPCASTCGRCDSVFSHHLPLYVQVPWERYKTSYVRSTTRRRSKAGKHPVSLKQVSSIICQKIRSTQNISLIKSYSEFLRKHCTDTNVKVRAYRCMLNLLVNTNMYKEASKLVQEFIETEIPLSNLQLSSLKLLHNYCLRNLDKDKDVLTFPLPIKETYNSSSESDAEE
ncbi:hexokinase_2 domain-containing protein [Caerostris darwini]|uniref:Hexokinase_2 domain-containing protein n=1 Tax=Caerostris darwini TaxID=1538125 RepID=A0AAV4R8Z3_9ARAC|nr:hexokinase_2 domain-containing protein [Caerostris darwini]